MRLGTLRTAESTTAVLIDGEYALPIEDDGTPLADVGALLRSGRVEELVAAAVDRDERRPLDPERLAAPILEPGAVVCVGLNYRTHILEMGRELPATPTYFAKLARALTDPYARIEVPPAGAAAVDYEGELVAVIGTAGRDVEAEDAWDHIAGLTVMNDVSMRDYQRRTLQWFAGKTWEASTPVGPWVVSVGDLGDLDKLVLETRVNDEVRQQASIGDLVHDLPALIADLSKIVTLRPGDLIATGTPGGVGEACDGLLGDGDQVEVEISGIGAVRNTIHFS